MKLMHTEVDVNTLTYIAIGVYVASHLNGMLQGMLVRRSIAHTNIYEMYFVIYNYTTYMYYGSIVLYVIVISSSHSSVANM